MNNFVTFSLCVILYHLIGSVQCYECNFFNNIDVIVTPNLNDLDTKSNATIRGCIEPGQFSTRVEGIEINRKNIGILGDHAVNNLLHLKFIYFDKCDIRTISPRTFENLPNLQEIWIINSKLTSIPPGTFKNMTSLEIVVLDGGRISSIGTDAFAKGTKEISLEQNMLREINHLWFINSSDLIGLYFRSNKIQRLTKQNFMYTPNLKHLDLSRNEIRYIADGTFRNLKNLDILDLGYNRIVKLDQNIVSKNFKIKKINLRCNFLNFLSRSLLEKISVKTMILSGNPWECACLEQIQKWMVEWNVISENHCKLTDVPYCVYGTEASVCSGKVDANITKSFLKALSGVVDENCANLS